MHSTTDKWKMVHGIFMKRGNIILLIFRSEGKKKLNSNCHQQSLKIRIDSYRIVDLIIIITLFTIKLVLYFKIYKHVSRTLDISTLNETTSRRKIKRVKLTSPRPSPSPKPKAHKSPKKGKEEFGLWASH